MGYKVTFMVELASLDILLGATKNTKGVVLASVEPTGEPDKKPRTVHRPHQAVHGSADRQNRARDIVLIKIREKKCMTHHEVENLLEAAGYSRSTSSPTLSVLKKDKLVQEIDRGVWEAVA